MITIPNELKAVLIVLLTEGIVSLGRQMGADLSGKAAMLAAALVGAFVTMADGLIASLPAQWQGVVGGVLQVLVLVLSAMGLNDFAKTAMKAGRTV